MISNGEFRCSEIDLTNLRSYGEGLIVEATIPYIANALVTNYMSNICKVGLTEEDLWNINTRMHMYYAVSLSVISNLLATADYYFINHPTMLLSITNE